MQYKSLVVIVAGPVMGKLGVVVAINKMFILQYACLQNGVV